ncbi:MAG: cytochrome c oxidase subunit II [Candidatus Omnitrophica bacterium]|nr:cytochrome c oxidase subunit II [Candidatus Omnitrophota bacterium]
MQKYYGWGLPFDASTHGAAIDHLINIVHIFMAVLFVGWLVYLVFALVKFRQRPGHQATYKEHHFKASSYIEVAVVLVEVALLVGFSFPIFGQYRNQLPPLEKSLEVRVVAEQFAWNIHYPGADGVFGKTASELISPGNPVGLDREDPAGKDDVTTINQFHVPVHKPVIVRLSSKDVIHSFSLPVMRVKQDTIPGQNISVWFEATQTGKFEIACAQLCGLGHYRMRGFFIIDTPEVFEAWLKERAPKPPPPPPTPAVAIPVESTPAQPEIVRVAATPQPQTAPAPAAEAQPVQEQHTQ